MNHIFPMKVLDVACFLADRLELKIMGYYYGTLVYSNLTQKQIRKQDGDDIMAVFVEDVITERPGIQN